MSIVQPTKDAKGNISYELLKATINGDKTDKVSEYKMNDEEKSTRSMILKHFVLGITTMNKPRVEFNDMSVVLRDQIDQMSFNTYQANNGDPYEGDELNAWKSRAMRPVVRNKAISIAAHATARLIFPKVFAYDSASDEQQDAAQVMMDLMEWAADQSNYANFSLYRTITALYSPASIGYTEYAEAYRTVKTEKNAEGKWQTEQRIDPDMSGFQDVVVPVDQLYIENFFESDIQKQGWLIWRKVISYSVAQAKYQNIYPNFKYVEPGVQLILDDANQYFYQVYDTNMRQENVEEIIYWNRTLDLKIIMVNGVMLTDADNPNPRNDKLYPFDKFGYEIINNRCFYYKSLVFKMQQDANIINTLYPMIIDGTYLSLMPPMVAVGSEMIGSDVYVPGAVTTMTSPDADLRAIHTNNNITAGINTLMKIDESISESSQDAMQAGQDPKGGSTTAYEISRLEQNANTVLGLFIQMISKHVKEFGKLRLGDILQYLTIADVGEITDDAELVYKTFLLPNRQSEGKTRTRKIQFDNTLPDEPITNEQKLSLSRDTLNKQGGILGTTELYRANPKLVRELSYIITVSPDVLNPRSEDLERAYDLETYDKMINDPLHDPEETYRLLLASNPKTRRNPDKYIAKNPQQQLQDPMQPQNGQKPQPGKPAVAAPAPIGGQLPTAPLR